MTSAPFVARDALTTFFALLVVTSDGAWRHDVDRQAFRDLANRPEFAAAGRREIDGEATRGGSGVLIAPRWVLTAAHVVDNWTEGADYRFRWGDATVPVVSVRLHPAYRSARSLDERVDSALVELGTAPPSIAPLPIYDGDVPPGTCVAIVGHGFAQPANTLGADQTPPGDTYAGYNVVDCIGANHLFIDIDSPGRPELNVLGSPDPDPLEYGPLGGDSGGGVIAMLGGRPMVVAVIGTVSFTVERLSKHGWYGLPNRLNRSGPHLDWIRQITGAAR